MLDLDSLNREQLEAVLTTEGPLLVLAGAGSGKTRVITYRLAHLLHRGVHPRSILAVTFTNKAAFEMKERAKKLAGKAARGTTISTFHALGARILRTCPDRVGLKAGFSICDGGEQMGTLRRILRTLRIDDRKFDAKRLMVVISHAKNAGIDSGGFREAEGDLLNAAGESIVEELMPDDDYRVAAIEAYEKYESALRAQNVVDFDDLLLLTLRLLQTDDEIRERLTRRWQYLMIDEYQDTNGAQFELMRVLAGERRNLCVVGDDDQSIYGWRGADVENILRFSTHFPGAKTVMLETNYRSTGNILEVANAIIEKNANRYDKRLKPAAGDGDKVKIVALEDEDAEAEEIADAIVQLQAKQVPLEDVAVLYRSNVQSRAIELALRTAHVPYRVVGGMDLFDKKEIKDALAYLKVLVNADDEQSMRRILNYPPRGIGDTTIKRIDDWARGENLPLVDGLNRAYEVDTLSEKGADAVASFMELLAQHKKLLKRQKASTVARKLFDAVELEATLFASTDDPQSASRKVDNVRAVLEQLDRFEKRVKKKKKRAAFEAQQEPPEDDEDEDDALFVEMEEASLGAFLSDLALSGWEDSNNKDDKEEKVILSTIHASKGLEWPHVFLVGVEEELLPHRRTLEGDGHIDEERRLAYVAVTRARTYLTVSYATSRTKWGQVVPRERSRFLEDLPDERVDRCEGTMLKASTPEEAAEVEAHWRKKIRAQLGID
ncbi:MAG: 3'-5' exonuclease [Deltaproteobacteria bacterium]